MTEHAQPPAGSYRFQGYTLDIDQRELRSGGSRVEVQPRVFDLLVYLATHHRRAVDKDELQDAVWPGTVVTETALTRAVMKARKAVGDDANQQRVIKTVHGHGYRFVADVETVASPLAAPADPAEKAPGETEPTADPAPNMVAESPVDLPDSVTDPAGHDTSGWWRPALALLAVIAMIAAAGWWFRTPPPLPVQTRVAVLPLIDRTGDNKLSWTRLGLMSYVSNLFESDGKLRVVADVRVITLADTLHWPDGSDDLARSRLVERLRDVYGATHILAMKLSPEGAALRMDYELVDLGGERHRGTLVGEEGPDLAQGVVQGVYGTLLGITRERDQPALASSDPFNNEAFARGMDMSLQGRCAEAVAFFRLIMEQEPDLFAPRFQFAACQRVLGENAEAETLLDELVAQLRVQGANRDLAQVLMTRGVLYNRTGRLDLAKADHEAALAILEHFEDPELRARVLQNLSIVEEDQGNFDRAEELLDLAVLAYQEAGRETLPGHLYSGRANLQMDRGELVTARDYLEQALRAFREAGDRRNEAMMLNNTGYLLREMGKLEEAEGYHLRSLEMREAIGDQVGVGRVYGQLAALYTAQGRHREAADAGRSALAIAQERGDRLYEGTALAQIAAAESASGNNAEARSTYEDSRAVFTDIGDQMRVLQVDLELARLDVGEGRLDAAEHTGLRVAEAAAALSLVQPEVEALQLQGEVAAARGDVPAAVVAFRRALDRVREASWDGKQAEITVQLIHAYLDTDDTRAAAPLAGALQGFPASVVSLRARARFAWADGEPEQARRLMLEARAMAGEHWDADSEQQLAKYQSGQ